MKPVDFNDEFCFWGVEIDDVIAKRSLAVELDVQNLLSPDLCPEAIFAFGLVGSQAAGEGFEFFVVVRDGPAPFKSPCPFEGV